jgi:hypothetical protein
MNLICKSAGALAAMLLAPAASAALIVYEAAGANAAAITPTRDAFRTAVGGGTTAGANGSFGGLRREINWDGVPDIRADPQPPAGRLLQRQLTARSGVQHAGNRFPGQRQRRPGRSGPVRLPERLPGLQPATTVTAVNSNITDVSFFVPGTTTAATTSAFAAIFVDVEVLGLTTMEFFDESGSKIFSRDVPVGGNQGLSFLGAVFDAGERISRVRLTSGVNTIVANGVLGNPNDDVVVMDDFLYAEPNRAVPEPAGLTLAGLGLLGGLRWLRRRRQDA